MKLTFFMFTDLRVGRGTENVLFNLLKYKPGNIDVTIISTDDNSGNSFILSDLEVSELTENCRIIKINKTTLKLKKLNKITRLYRDLIYRPTIKTLKSIPENTLKEIRDTDIVYLFFNEYSIFFYDMDIPVIGSNHTAGLETEVYTDKNVLYYRLYYKLLHKLYLKNINGFHVFPYNSDVLSKMNLKYNMVLPVGVDTSLFYPDYSINNKKIKFLFVAALTHEKGLDILLQLIDRINNDNVEFHIAGGGLLSNEIKNNKKIIYHGVLSDKDLSELYRNCDIFIYPSHWDTFSIATLQALSSGLYVLCLDYLRGNFDDFENKYLEYLPLNIDIWYNKVNEIISNRDIIKHNKKEEYNYVKNNYDWSIISRKFYDYMVKFYNESKELKPINKELN